MRGQDLIARKSVLVQEHDGRPGSGEERRERRTGAAGADNDNIMTGCSSHGRSTARHRIAFTVERRNCMAQSSQRRTSRRP